MLIWGTTRKQHDLDYYTLTFVLNFAPWATMRQISCSGLLVSFNSLCIAASGLFGRTRRLKAVCARVEICSVLCWIREHYLRLHANRDTNVAELPAATVLKAVVARSTSKWPSLMLEISDTVCSSLDPPDPPRQQIYLLHDTKPVTR